MHTAEVQITDADFTDRLKEMRIWFDANCFEPSVFKYFFLSPGMRVRISFSTDNEASAFATEFGGTVLADAAD